MALRQNNNPMVLVALNDGTMSYNLDRDGEGMIQGSCVRHFRNPATPTYAKVTYFNNTITVCSPGARVDRPRLAVD